MSQTQPTVSSRGETKTGIERAADQEIESKLKAVSLFCATL